MTSNPSRFLAHALLLTALAFVLVVVDAQTRVVRVKNNAELVNAIRLVQPGDEIVVASGGMYYSPLVPRSFVDDAYLTSMVAGTATRRIVLRGENRTNPPVIFGTDIQYWSIIRLLDGAHYWTIQDLVLNVAQKGIVVDSSNYVEIKRVYLQRFGEEAIHIRSGSKHTLIEDCTITDTGLDTPGYGEGIYIGSDRSVHNLYAPDVGYTTVRNCKIGPMVRAEAFDVKEGSFETVIEHNIVDAKGITGQNFADSFVDLKGTRAYVRYNQLYRSGATMLTKGIAVIDRGVANSADENVIHDNIFNFDDGGTSIPMVAVGGNIINTIVFDNSRIPKTGGTYQGIVSQSCCPSWYKRPPDQITPTVCFSGSVKVREERRGPIWMRDLKVGDRVLVDEGKYGRVYMFGHRDEAQHALFLRFSPSNLEISPDHMVFVQGKGPIPASMVEVGDRFSDGKEVSNMTITYKTGVYAPFTSSGMILVNNVLASTYVSFQGSEKVMMSQVKLTISYQWLAHSYLTLPRLWCQVLKTSCPSHGISTWVNQSHCFGTWLVGQNWVVMSLLLLPLLLCLFVLSSLEHVLLSPMVVFILILGFCVTWFKRRLSQKAMLV